MWNCFYTLSYIDTVEKNRYVKNFLLIFFTASAAFGVKCLYIYSYCIRGDGEEIRNFLHRIKRTVDKGWPNDLNGIEAARHAAEREAQGRQISQIYIDYSLEELRPRYLQRKAQDYLMEHPNATWNDFCAQIIQKI